MKYQLLDLQLLQKIYKKDKSINVYFIEGNPNEEKLKLEIGQIIPTGDIEEKNTFSAKKSLVYKDFLLSNNSLIRKSKKFYFLPCKFRFTKNDNWINDLVICGPNNLIASNCFSMFVWIKNHLNSLNINSSGKSKPLRKSPTESATLFNVGTIKVGNDKNKWKIIETKNGVKRWMKI